MSAVAKYLEAGDILAHYASQQAALPAESGAWLSEYRGRALQRLRERGFPTPRDENWKYTRVSAIEKRAFTPGTGAADAFPDPADAGRHAICPDFCARLVFLDGVFDPALSALDGLPAGVSLEPLAGLLSNEVTAGSVQSEMLEALRGELAAAEQRPADGFVHLGAAFLRHGLVLRIDTDIAVELPIELLFLASGVREDTMAQPLIWIEAAAGAQAIVVESYAALGQASYLTNASTQVRLGEGAKLTHCKLQMEGASGYHVARLFARLGANARFDSTSISLGARLARNDIDIHLEGQAAHATLDGLMLARSRQHTDFHTRVDHLVANASSDEYYKGIFDDRSRGVFNGSVYVHPGADGTDAQQQNRNLLLSRNAEVDTKPQLEIFADEVKCSHGATVGQLDDGMLFYLRSRGLSKELARSMLIYGFAREIVDRIADPKLRQAVAGRVLAELPGGDALGELRELGE